MKIYSLLIVLSIVLAFFSGRIAFMVKDQEKLSRADIELIHSFVQEMRERAGAVLYFDLKKSYPNQSYLELLTPKANYSKSYTPLNSLSCMKAMRNSFSHRNIKKEDIWMGFRCRVTTELPDKFFETPPYIHPSGTSYAYLAFRNLYNQRGSTGRFLPYFHLSELKLLKVELPPLQQLFTELESNEILKIINGDKFFLTKKYLLVNNGLLDYSVFSLRNINVFLKRKGYLMKGFKQTKNCDYRIGDVCINRTQNNLINHFSETTYIIFAGALFILFMTVFSLYSRIEKQNREEERKRHALRVLTHELRTPIASLLLQIDSISADEYRLSEELEERLLRIESDIYRLKYLAEKSQGYLQADSKQLIQFKNVEIKSFNDFIKGISDELENEDGQILLDLSEDIQITLDPYWVQMCFANLITNAQKYGQKPICVSSKIEEKWVVIKVQDGGEIQVKNLKELLAKPKVQNAQGMGIGLEIVQRTLKEMGGRLSLDSSPTTFIMKIPRQEERNS